MQRFYEKTTKHPNIIIALFLIAFVVCLICKPLVSVDYDMNDYLPSDSKSTVSLNVMEKEFDGGIPNARVMVKNCSIAKALEYKERIAKCEGVTDVTWLDDAEDIAKPVQVMDKKTVGNYYVSGNALFSVTVDEEKCTESIDAIRKVIGTDNAMTGSAVSTAVATESTVSQIRMISVIAVLFVLFMLILTTKTWFEPILVLAGLGIAIVINAGSNLIFGEISFVTNAAGTILQLAVSLDYSVFLIHRFEESRKKFFNPRDAMIDALCKSTSSILSSGLTTVIGFLALCLMRFKIGSDLGIALAKGVGISLITVFILMPAIILKTYKLLEKTKHKPFLPKFDKFGKLVSKLMLPLTCIFAVMIVPAYLASNSNSFYYGSSHIFNENTQYGADTANIEKIFGISDTYVCLVPNGSNSTQKKLSDAMKKNSHVTGIISYVDTVGQTIPTEYIDSDTYSKLVSKNYSRMVISVKAEYEGEDTFELVEDLRGIAQKYYPDKYYLAGAGVSTYDLKTTVEADMVKVNLIAIVAVFIVLLLSMKSLSLPFLLVISIETAIWINLSIPYFAGNTIFYIAYLIISSIQLGATVDYAILLTDRYMELRKEMNKKQSIKTAVSACTLSILTSALSLTVVGFLLGIISTHGLLSQLGMFLGKGTLCSLGIVLFVLPGLLYIFDSVIKRTTKGADFYDGQ